MIQQHKDELKHVLYHVFLGAVLITVNIYFLVFVHYKDDLAPNFALAITTLPFAVNELYTAITYKPKYKKTTNQKI